MYRINFFQYITSPENPYYCKNDSTKEEYKDIVEELKNNKNICQFFHNKIIFNILNFNAIYESNTSIVLDSFNTKFLLILLILKNNGLVYSDVIRYFEKYFNNKILFKYDEKIYSSTIEKINIFDDLSIEQMQKALYNALKLYNYSLCDLILDKNIIIQIEYF